jgi:hypothetical protein
MACLVKRYNGTIDKVYLPDGKTLSQTYYKLQEAVDHMPDQQMSILTQALAAQVGKTIKNLDDTSEIALGLYMNLYSADFKSFFGDWLKARDEYQDGKYKTLKESLNANNVSELVNEIGEPRVVYHGAGVTDTFRTFRTEQGAYFTNLPEVAQGYTGINESVYPVYLNIKNLNRTGINNLDEDSKQLDKNKDGYIAINDRVPDMTHEEIVVFKSNQIKAVHNSGEFSEATPDIFRSIRHAKGKTLLSYVKLSLGKLRKREIDLREKRSVVENNPDLSFAEKTEKIKYFNNLISDTREQIKILKEKNSLKYVLLLAQSDLQMADAILTSSKTTLSELRIALDAAETWKEILQILGYQSVKDITDPDVQKEVQDIQMSAHNTTLELARLANKILIKESGKNNMARPLTGKDVDPNRGLADVNFFTGMLRDISNTGVPLVNYLATILNEANFNIEKEHNRNYRSIDAEFELVKEHPEFKKNGFDIFFKIQKNKSGFETLGLRGPYSQSYYDDFRKQRAILKAQKEAAGDDKERIKSAYQDYNKWVKNNTFIFNAVPFIDLENYTDQQREQVITDMTALGFKSYEIAEMVKRTQDLYDSYIQGIERFKINLEFDLNTGNKLVPDGKDQATYIAEETERWKIEHDPVTYIQQQNGLFKEGATNAYKGSYYTLKVPRKTIDGKATTHYDEAFMRIAGDPKLFRFYQFFKDFINSQLENLPEEEVNDLASNFMPVITQRMAMEIGLTDLKEKIRGAGDWIMNHLTAVDIDRKQETDPLTGVAINRFQASFTNENVPVEERSKDMVVMMKMFSDMALIYKHKVQVQDHVETINTIIQGTDKTQKVFESTGDVEIVSKSPEMLKKMVDSSILNSFYGKKPDEGKLTSKRKFYSIWELASLGLYKSPEYKSAKVLEDEIKKLNKEIDNDTLTEEELIQKNTQLSELKEKYRVLGGRQFSFVQTSDSLNKLTRLTALAIQPFSAFRNLAVGALNNQIHAVGGEDFNRKQLLMSKKYIKESSKKFLSWGTLQSKQAEKLLRFMLDTGTIEGEDGIFRNGVLEKNPTLDRIKAMIPSPFVLMKSTDYLFKSETAVSKALATKVYTTQGEFNLYEVLDENLNLDTAKYGQWDPAQNGDLSFDDFYRKEMLKINQLAKKLHGLSGRRASMMVNDSVWGRMAIVFKSWLPETFATRFEGKRYDPLLERDVEGYYRTFFSILQKEGFGVFKEMFNAVFSKQVGNMTELERANLRKGFAEMMTILTLMALYYSMKAMAPEDEEKRKKYMLLLNQINLLQRDMSYYSDINSFADLTNNVIPSVRTIRNIQAAGKALSFYALDIENEDGEPMYDGERTLLKVTKALPVINNYNRIIYYSDKLAEDQR